MACINESQNDTLDVEKWDMVNVRKGGSFGYGNSSFTLFSTHKYINA